MGQLEKCETHQMYSGIDCRSFFVIQIGFEPMAYSLEGCRSIQLSNRKKSDSLLKYPKWANDKASFNGVT